MSVTTTLPELEVEEQEHHRVRRQPPYHVILHDSPDHSYQYVMRMVQMIFQYQPERCFQLAKEVDEKGRVILKTCSRELAELKQDQIQNFGADPTIPRCKGSMTATIEPAE